MWNESLPRASSTMKGTIVPSNDRVLLDDLLAQRKQDIAPNSNDSDFFELFVAQQILKNYGLSYDDIESGIVDGGNDGGIDSIYLFLNGELVSDVDDVDLSVFRHNIKLDLIVIQSKVSAGFSELAIERFIGSSRDLLDLSVDIE